MEESKIKSFKRCRYNTIHELQLCNGIKCSVCPAETVDDGCIDRLKKMTDRYFDLKKKVVKWKKLNV